MQNIEKLKKSKIGVNKIAINYSPVISRITNLYPPNSYTRYVEQSSIAVEIFIFINKNSNGFLNF